MLSYGPASRPAGPPARAASSPVSCHGPKEWKTRCKVADISIGADVMAADDKLGEVTRAIVDAHSGKVTDIVVKHGVLLTHERIVPLGHVIRAADGKVYLDLDEKGLEAMNGFAREIKGPNPDYVGPPSEDLQGTYRGNEAFEEMAAAGSA